MGYCSLIICFVLLLMKVRQCSTYFDCTTDSSLYDSCLYEKLFVNQTYYNRCLPRNNLSDPVDVIVSFAIRSLNGIDDKNQIMSVTGYITLIWQDPRLTWNESDIPILEFIVQADNVWLPDVAISNSIVSFYDQRFRQEFRVSIYSDGYIFWEFGGMFSTTCNLDITNYPFDSQQCYIQLENWRYTVDDVRLVLDTNRTRVDVTDYQNDSLWDLTGTSYTVSASSSPTVDTNKRSVLYPQVQIIFNWKRKSGYYVINFIVPAILLTCITFAVFWVPAGGGERIGLGITVLLAFTVYQIVLGSVIPATSDQYPILGNMLLAMLILATMAQLSSVLMCIIDQETSRPVPTFVKTIFLGRLATILCVRNESEDFDNQPQGSAESSEKKWRSETLYSVQEINGVHRYGSRGGWSSKLSKPTADVRGSRDEKTKYNVPASSTYSREWDAVIANIKAIRAILDQKEEESRLYQEWQRLARVIDRLLFTAAAIGFGVYIIVLSSKVKQ